MARNTLASIAGACALFLGGCNYYGTVYHGKIGDREVDLFFSGEDKILTIANGSDFWRYKDEGGDLSVDYASYAKNGSVIYELHAVFAEKDKMLAERFLQINETYKELVGLVDKEIKKAIEHSRIRAEKP